MKLKTLSTQEIAAKPEIVITESEAAIVLLKYGDIRHSNRYRLQGGYCKISVFVIQTGQPVEEQIFTASQSSALVEALQELIPDHPYLHLLADFSFESDDRVLLQGITAPRPFVQQLIAAGKLDASLAYQCFAVFRNWKDGSGYVIEPGTLDPQTGTPIAPVEDFSVEPPKYHGCYLNDQVYQCQAIKTDWLTEVITVAASQATIVATGVASPVETIAKTETVVADLELPSPQTAGIKLIAIVCAEV